MAGMFIGGPSAYIGAAYIGGDSSGSPPSPPVQARRSAGRRQYIVQGMRYLLTTEELSYLLARLASEEQRSLVRQEVQVVYPSQKAHAIGKEAWAEMQEFMARWGPRMRNMRLTQEDDDDAARILL